MPNKYVIHNFVDIKLCMLLGPLYMLKYLPKLFHLSMSKKPNKLMVSASDLLIGVETRSFDVVFFVRYQFWFANGTGYQYDGAHCSELSKLVQKVYEVLIYLRQNDRLFCSF